ncbi:MAG: sugar kinase [Paracoccaceae bacterium]
MKTFLSIGEAMVELSQAGGGDLWRLGFAGDTLNTAWYARACLSGDWQVEYLTRLGNDPFSPRMLAFLQQSGIGTRHVEIDRTRSVGLYSIELHAGERSFAYWRGQSAARLLADDPALLDRAFGAADAVYLSGITLAILPDAGREALIARLVAARRAGKLTAFDPNLRPRLWQGADAMRHWLTRAAEGAEILLPSFEDEAEWFGDAGLSACAARWQAAGAAEVVVKNGGGPIGLLDDTGYREFGVARLPPSIRRAGDSFNGSYLANRLCGAETEPALRRAHAVAAHVVTARGALVPLAPGLAGDPAG